MYAKAWDLPLRSRPRDGAVAGGEIRPGGEAFATDGGLGKRETNYDVAALISLLLLSRRVSPPSRRRRRRSIIEEGPVVVVVVAGRG